MAKTIKFDPDRLPIAPKSRKRFCKHEAIIVVEATRTIECRACGSIIDPFDFLWRWAITGRGYQQKQQSLKAECEKYMRELARLRKMERNIKARIKRAKEKEVVRPAKPGPEGLT